MKIKEGDKLFLFPGADTNIATFDQGFCYATVLVKFSDHCANVHGTDAAGVAFARTRVEVRHAPPLTGTLTCYAMPVPAEGEEIGADPATPSSPLDAANQLLDNAILANPAPFIGMFPTRFTDEVRGLGGEAGGGGATADLEYTDSIHPDKGANLGPNSGVFPDPAIGPGTPGDFEVTDEQKQAMARLDRSDSQVIACQSESASESTFSDSPAESTCSVD